MQAPYFFAVMLAAGCMLGSCSSGQKQQEETPADSTATADASAESWKPLFDGKSLEGWKMYRDIENDSWEVVDGTLHCKPAEEAEKRADLMTIAEYDNFELAFEWKLSKAGNSGVMFHVTEEYDQPYYSGPEYQIIDDVDFPAELKAPNTTAGNYDMQAPIGKKLKPVGEWNTSRIVVNGPHVEHWLNGDKVVEYELGSEEWKKQKAASKWNETPGYGASPSGHIDLQDHGYEIWFRDIMIREI